MALLLARGGGGGGGEGGLMSTKICCSRGHVKGRGALSQGNATVSDVNIEIRVKSNSV